MAAVTECSISRCSNERRTFRKELQKWGRNVLLLVGLERIAEEVTGKRKWRRLMQPMNQIDAFVSGDWEPDELCFFCNARKQPPLDPASGIIAIDTVNSIKTEEQDADLKNSTNKGEQPLDLSLTSSKPIYSNGIIPSYLSEQLNETEENEDDVIKVPQLPSKSSAKKSGISLCSNLSKRSYTEEELQAALRDIQSGKLGTRRAAVIYGIPRSTLRNKVYKLTNGRGRSRQAYLKCGITTPGLKAKEENIDSEVVSPKLTSTLDDGKNKVVHSASESLRQLLKHRMAEKAAEIKAKSDVSLKINLQNGDDECKTSDQINSQGITPLLSQVFANIHNLALSSHKSLSQSNYDLNSLEGFNSDHPFIPLIPDLIHRLTEERFQLEREKYQDRSEPSKVDSTKDTPISCESNSSSSVILKIPSYKPSSKSIDNTTSPSSSSGDISERFQPKAENKSDIIIAENESDSEELCSTKRAKNCTSADSSSSETSVEKKSTKSVKQKRPKRGRYRNYNRDSLLEAVRAVQRGEMSVHRAGSFYGVPHSTLEYKVKERHLLRPRKRDKLLRIHSDKLVPIQPAVKKEDGKLLEDEDSKQNGLSTKSHSSTQSASSNSSISLYPPLDFNQLAAANQFFASQMMRKLQEDAIMNSERVKNSRDSSSNVFGNLIKNSLEQAYKSGVPTPKSTPVSILAAKAEAK